MSDQVKAVVVCLLTTDEPDPVKRVPGTAESTCESCGAAIWVSPSSSTVVERHGRENTSFICTPCGEQVSGNELLATPEQRAEIEALHGQRGLDFIDRLQSDPNYRARVEAAARADSRRRRRS